MFTPASGNHTLDGDIMWFAWALQLEAAHAIAYDNGHASVASSEGGDSPAFDDRGEDARRALLLAGVVTGCPANFAWRGHRRTRAEYHPDAESISLLRARGLQWASDFTAAAAEVHALYRIREWGDP